MEDTDSTEVKYKIRQWSLPGDAIVPVLNVSSRVFWLNWMIKLSWTAIRCYRRVSSVTCFRRSVLRRGRALEVKGLQLASCCQAAKMRMTGLTSCYRRRTFGLPLQRGVLLQRKSQHRYSAKSGEGCRPSICDGGQAKVGGAS